MKTKHLFARALAFALVVAMVMSFLPGAVFAADTGRNGKITWEKTEGSGKRILSERLAKDAEEVSEYKDTDSVRVSIILDAASTLAKGYMSENIANNASAMAYRSSLKSVQASMEKTISEKALGGEKLDVVWNLTLAANIISANVPYGKIEAIKAISGVKDVVIERSYAPCVTSIGGDDPTMATSGQMIGSYTAWAEGYTGAGSKVAIIDTGVDSDHQSLDASAYEYALSQNAEEKGMSVEEYKASLNLLDKDKIERLWTELNFFTRYSGPSSNLYLSSKIPFAANYVDKDLDVTHDHDVQGEHGSHVTGIAAANRFIKTANGFEHALDTVFTQGVAPDAQVITMKVFGKKGGAYDADYMVAIEDAIILGADSVNLSLGSGNPGLSNADAAYTTILDNITKSGTVVVMSAGNSGYWAENSTNGYLYSGDASFDTVGSPGSYTNTLAVASVDNDGSTGTYFKVGDDIYFYAETSGYSNKPMASVAGTYDYIYFDNTLADGDGVSMIDDYASAIKGKVVFGFRGTSSFFQKANAAAKNGAVATIICNNQPGVINMDLTGYTYSAPCVSILLSDALAIAEASTPVYGENGEVLYYTGKIEISNKMTSGNYYSDYYTMSSFSSWGVPGSLEMKPEITAPGGNIYSLFGSSVNKDTGKPQGGSDQYELMSGTSMAAPQVTGMAAVIGQYVRESGLCEKTGYTARQLGNALLMSTAEALMDGNCDCYYSVLNQGAGLANVAAAIDAESLIMMNADATESYKDGKVKVELGDDPDRKGEYDFGFTLENMSDEVKFYDLRADFFTQDIFADGYGDTYLDTWTTPLDASVTFSVNGKIYDGKLPEEFAADYDFDGNGEVNDFDADAILDYVIGTRESLNDAENADFDADGKITSYDAYLFLLALKAESGVKIEAGETADVKVNVKLNDIADFDDNGAYVEGYVFVDEIYAEDIETKTYSIPVLGYYGSWTEPSMYDVGDALAYIYGPETRAPYLYAATGNDSIYANSVLINYAGDSDSYYFGGNPVMMDDAYVPERNAVNANDTLSKINYALIRNAHVKAGVFDEEGKAVQASDLGDVFSAFYYTNGQSWQYTNRSAALNFNATGIEEGTKLAAKVIAAPEYYLENGKINWNELDEGSEFAVPFTVDNTAPELVGDITVEDGKMTFTVKDNQYIAGVFIDDNKGSTIAAQSSDLEAVPGEEMNVSVNVQDETRFLVEIYDYAANCTAYKINLNTEELDGNISIALDEDEITVMKNGTYKLNATVSPWGIEDDAVIWTSADESVATVNENGIVTGVSNGTTIITAAAHADPTQKAECAVTVESVQLYLEGVLQDENGNPIFFDWDLENETTWNRGKDLPGYLGSFAWNEDPLGVAKEDYGYLMTDEANLIKVDMATGDVLDESTGTAEFGAPMQDLAIPYYQNAVNGTDTMFGVYGGYLLQSEGMENTFTNGWNLSSYLQTYTKSTCFTTIAWAGIDKTNRDVFVALTDNGAVWYFFYDGTSSIGLNYGYSEATGFKWPGYDGQLNSSLIYSFNTGSFILSYFNGTTNELYEMFDGADLMTMRYIGNVGDEVWPAFVYAAYSTADDTADYTCKFAPANVISTVEASTGLSANAVTGSLNAVKASADTNKAVKKVAIDSLIEVDDAVDSDAIVVDIAPFDGKSDIATNNGFVEISYNADTLLYAGLSCTPAHVSHVNEVDEASGLGTIKFAYADLLGLKAGETALSVFFQPKKAGETNVKVDMIEANDDFETLASDTIVVNYSAPKVTRLSGHSRTDTAVAIANGTFDFADTVVLANGDNYADALAGVPLAYAMGAPILLVRKNLDDATVAEIERLQATNIVILGGEVAISKAVEDQLAKNYRVERIAGYSRYETAALIAAKLNEVMGFETDSAFVVSGANFPDALSVSSIAAVTKSPILYAAPNGDLNDTADYLKNSAIESVTIIGGPVAIAEAAEENLAALGIESDRVFAYSRYDTNLAIIEKYQDCFYGDTICVATGTDFPDALTGGVSAACNNAPMLLVGKTLTDAQAAFVESFQPSKIIVFGGDVAVSAGIVDTIVELAK